MLSLKTLSMRLSLPSSPSHPSPIVFLPPLCHSHSDPKRAVWLEQASNLRLLQKSFDHSSTKNVLVASTHRRWNGGPKKLNNLTWTHSVRTRMHTQVCGPNKVSIWYTFCHLDSLQELWGGYRSSCYCWPSMVSSCDCQAQQKECWKPGEQDFWECGWRAVQGRGALGGMLGQKYSCHWATLLTQE